MSIRLTVICLLVSLAAVNVSAFDFITDKGLGLGQTVLLSKSSASVLLTVPSGGLVDREGKVELGVNRKFELADLDQGYIAAAYRLKSFTGTVGLTQFGTGDYYTERTLKAGVAYHRDSLTLGATIATMLVDFGATYDRLTGVAFGLGGSYRSKRAYGALTIENVNSPSLSNGSEGRDPRLTAYAEVLGASSYSVTGRLTLQDSEKPQLGLGQIIRLSSMNSIFWGLSTQPTTYGGGVEISYKRSLITYATSYHPTLGFSHTISMTYVFRPI